MTNFEKYRGEAKTRWGDTDAYREHAEKTKNYSEETHNALAGEMDAIMAAFAQCMKKGEPAASPAAQDLVKRLQGHITENYYTCTPQILAALGQMYVADERFKRNIDKHAEGTAAFIWAAIEASCAPN